MTALLSPEELEWIEEYGWLPGDPTGDLDKTIWRMLEAYQSLLAECERLRGERADLLGGVSGDPMIDIARYRGWHPLEPGEEMSVGFASARYTIRREP